IALVVSDNTRFRAIFDAIAQHRRFERTPNEVETIPQLIRSKQDNLFTGYAVAYLMEGETVRSVDSAATVLSQLIGIESVPPAGRVAIGNWLATSYYRLTPKARQTVAEALVGVASADRTTLAYPAVSVL